MRSILEPANIRDLKPSYETFQDLFLHGERQVYVIHYTEEKFLFNL